MVLMSRAPWIGSRAEQRRGQKATDECAHDAQGDVSDDPQRLVPLHEEASQVTSDRTQDDPGDDVHASGLHTSLARPCDRECRVLGTRGRPHASLTGVTELYRPRIAAIGPGRRRWRDDARAELERSHASRVGAYLDGRSALTPTAGAGPTAGAAPAVEAFRDSPS
jgi:hypothetical protein